MLVTSVTVRVPAKINLQLAVGPLRPDGYHGLVTVFHAISLFDEVTAAPAAADSVTVSGEGAEYVPEDADDLALRAVRALRAEQERRGTASGDGTGPGDGVAVAIAKRIPVAGGMAGGSADAAAALVACNELWDAGLQPGRTVRSRLNRRQRRGLRGHRRNSRRDRARRAARPRSCRHAPAPLGHQPSPMAISPPQPSSASSTRCAPTRPRTSPSRAEQ